MRRFVFECDGCGEIKTTADSARPGYWADVSIGITGYTNWRSGGGQDQIVSRLLCGTCQISLRERADPKSWTRAAKEAAE